MQTAEEFSQAAQSESQFKKAAKNAGSSLASVTGKTCAIVGTVGMQAMVTIALWVVGALLINAMNLGLGGGLLVGFIGAYLLHYIGNGLSGGTWNVVEHATGLLG